MTLLLSLLAMVKASRPFGYVEVHELASMVIVATALTAVPHTALRLTE